MTLHELNTLEPRKLKEELYKCCGSSSWVKMMFTHFPVDDFVELLEDAEEVWFECNEEDWKEAFAQHPKIGDVESLKTKFADTAEWAAGEQKGVNNASPQTLQALADANKLYEEKFGYTFIVCATGRSAEEMLKMLISRLENDPKDEIKVAADEQNKITKLRLEKLLND